MQRYSKSYSNPATELGANIVITKKQGVEYKEWKRRQIIDYYLNALKIGYLTTVKELDKEFSMFLNSYFPGGMAELKRITGTEDVKIFTKRRQEIRAKKAEDIRDYIKENPSAKYSDVVKAVGVPAWYIPGGINQVRKELGIAPRYGKITPELREEIEEEIIRCAKKLYDETGFRPTYHEIAEKVRASPCNYLRMDEILQRAEILKNALTKNAKKRREAKMEKIIKYCQHFHDKWGCVPTYNGIERDLKLNISSYTEDSLKEILSKAGVSGIRRFQKKCIEKRQEKIEEIKKYVMQNPYAKIGDIEGAFHIIIRNYLPEGLDTLKENAGIKIKDVRKRKEILENYIQNLDKEAEIRNELSNLNYLRYCGFKDFEDIKAEALKSIKNSHSLNGFIITPKILTKALKNHYDGIAEEEASKIANHTLNFFDPNSDRIIDNILSQEDRNNFYTLEKEGMLIGSSDEVYLPNGRAWIIHYWELSKKRIFELALNSKKEKIKKEEDYSIYNTVPEEAWKRDKNAQKPEGY